MTKKLMILRKGLKRTKRPQYYYHITDKDWGKSVTLKPRVNGVNRGFDEPKLSRICVGPSISHCLASAVTNAAEMSIYRTRNKVLAYYPVEVHDVKYTREKWLLRPINFVYVGTLASSISEEVEWNHLDGSYDEFMKDKIDLINIIIAKYCFPTHP